MADPHDRPIDDHIFEVQVIGQAIEDPFEDALLRPSPEAAPNRVPRAKVLRQAAPWVAGAGNPEDGLEKQPVICASAARAAFLAGQKRRNALILFAG